MQSNLLALFKGKREAIELPKKRPVGRPKLEKPPIEVPDSLESEVRALKRQRRKETEDEIAMLVMRSLPASSGDAMPCRDDEAADVSSTALPLGDIEAGMIVPIEGPQAWTREKAREAGKLGAEFGRLGGRPKRKSFSSEALVVAGVPGKRHTRDETFGVEAKLKLCALVEKTVKETSQSIEVVVAGLSRNLVRPASQIWKAIEGKTKWEAIVAAAGRGNARRSEAQLPKYLWNRRSCKALTPVRRASGAGQKSHVEFLYGSVTAWLEDMRQGGHHVDKADLVIEFINVANIYLQRAKAKAEGVGLTLLDKRRILALEDRLPSLEAKPWARKYLANSLQRFSGARFLKPQRVMNLTPAEERCRAEATWQNFDQVLYGCMKGEDAFMRQRFANPEQAKENVRQTVLLFSDQVPVWIKITPLRQLYAKGEVKKKSSKPSAADMLMQLSGQSLMSQKVDEATASQHRGRGISEQDRYRITYEACQAVFDYFDEEKDPRGAIVRSSIILPGSHGRLHNLSDEGCFLADEAFVLKGKEVLRKAGSKSRGLLNAWVEMRRTSAEVRKMLEVVDVYQQPAAFADAIVTSWIIERSAEAHVQAIHQRDLFAGALGESAKRASWLGHQAQCWIGGKMTSVLQLTDTDVAFPFKAAVRRSKDDMKRDMRAVGEASGKAASFACGPAEMLKLIYEAHMHTVQLNAKDNLVLAGLRRNGMLSWRPSVSQMKLVRSDSQQWAKDLPEVSHRYPAEWLKDRYSWLDEAGAPCEPRWKLSGAGVNGPEDMMDITFHGEEGEVVKLASCGTLMPNGFVEPSIVIECDQEHLDCKLSLDLFEASKAARIEAHLGKLIKPDSTKAKDKVAYRAKRLQYRNAARCALRGWRKSQREMLKTYSRKQFLHACVPEAGRSKKAKILEGASKKDAKVSRCRLLGLPW